MTRPNEYHWIFGAGIHLEFSNGNDPQLVNTTTNFSTGEGCASISDSNGNLLFYTDGVTLYDSSHGTVTVPSTPGIGGLGGNDSTAHSAIIVPPAGGGSQYHIFTLMNETNRSPIRYTPIDVSGLSVSVNQAPIELPGTTSASEHMAATSHEECEKYWVVGIDFDGGRFLVYLVDGDNPPSMVDQSGAPVAPGQAATYSYAGGPPTKYRMKFSPDGSLLAIGNHENSRIDIYNFNRGSGALTPHSQITDIPATGGYNAYGLEFSPNSQVLYFTESQARELRQHVIGSTVNHNSTNVIWTNPSNAGTHPLGALQLGPNGKIYGIKGGENTLLAIEDPDTVNLPGFRENALSSATGQPVLEMNNNGYLGLPSFTRVADECLTTVFPPDETCREIANDVNDQLSEQGAEHVNQMPPCDAEMDSSGQPIIPEQTCEPADVPDYRPHIAIIWGDSPCDCIESDDTEIMNVTICNPYSNVNFRGVKLSRIRVVMADGTEVPLLPDGTPSVQLVPVGPYCFGRLRPCSCVSRQFILRNRGAVSGPYKILLEGLCFDVRTHVDINQCFTFDICED